MMQAVTLVGYNSDLRRALSWQPAHPKPEPDASKSQVRVRVAFAASNPIDAKFAYGDYDALMKHPFPCPAGRDFSGWIDVIPMGCPNPNNFKVGDRVCGFLDHENLSAGSFAEFLCCPIKILAKVPESVELRDAAGLALHGITTYVALLETFKLSPGCGKKILILGGSSATGMLALQLARLYDCSDVVCTSTNVDLCKSLGATKVIDYRKSQWWDDLKGADFDFVYDTVGGENAYELSKAVLHPKTGQFYTIVGDLPSGKVTFGALIGAICAMKCRGCCGGPKYQMGMNLPSDADRGVTFWLELMRLRTVRVVLDPSSPYPFSVESAVAMLDKQASGRCKGKLVMAVCPE